MAVNAINEDVITEEKALFSGELLGRAVAFEYSKGVIAYAILGLRLVMGWVFLQAGLDKVFNSEWTAAGFLEFAIPENNPFKASFADMAGSGLVDFMVQWGLTAVGFALILGIFVRFSAFWGAVMMVLFWAASLTGGAFLELEHGWLVDDHIVYAGLLFGLGALGAGRIFGLDSIIEKSSIVRENTWLKYLLG